MYLGFFCAFVLFFSIDFVEDIIFIKNLKKDCKKYD